MVSQSCLRVFRLLECFYPLFGLAYQPNALHFFFGSLCLNDWKFSKLQKIANFLKFWSIKKFFCESQ